MVRSRKAKVADVHEIAAGMPHTTCTDGRVYQVGGKSFVIFRTERPDAVDPETGEPYDDVIVIWVAEDGDKQALLESDGPWFTTDHFNGHRSVLVRGSRIGQLKHDELREVIQDAWLARASKRRGAEWLKASGISDS